MLERMLSLRFGIGWYFMVFVSILYLSGVVSLHTYFKYTKIGVAMLKT